MKEQTGLLQSTLRNWGTVTFYLLFFGVVGLIFSMLYTNWNVEESSNEFFTALGMSAFGSLLASGILMLFIT